jgi:alpha-galactosidase
LIWPTATLTDTIYSEMHRHFFRELFSARGRIAGLFCAMSAMGALKGQEIPPELQAKESPSDAVWVDSLNLRNVEQGFGTAEKGRSVEHHPLTLGGVIYQHGVGTHAVSLIAIDLHGTATRFQAAVGVDDERKGAGSVTFSVWTDGKKLMETPVLRGGDTPQLISVDLTGAKHLNLVVGDGGDGIMDDHADWGGALITLAAGTTQKPTILADGGAAPRLKILPESSQPAIHGPRIVGATPGHPFLFPVAATGTAPLIYSARNLPAGLRIDPGTGIISGALREAGTTQVTLKVHGPAGTAQRQLTVVGGANKLALTPPMGWNSWNAWADKVDEGKVKDAANELISAGLVAHGYQYINIDDTWEAGRDQQGNIQANKKFPDMKALCDEIHSKGLKIGIYSSPGPKTCGGFTGSYGHEDQDAQTYADWGFDLLKYDLCSYRDMIPNHSAQEIEKPYRVMAAALAKTNRDILYSLCEYGWGDVWKWGADPDIRGNCWRTHDDIDDVWTGSSSWGRDRGVYDIIQAEVGLEKYAGPGHWNDPDMLMVGIVGFGHPHPTRLTPNEQILHVSMWCLLSAPLLIGCDMTKLDPFTLAILTNDEVLDIDQDPLGKPAGRVSQDKAGSEVWSRELADGTHAVGLLNSSLIEQNVTVRWSDIGVSGRQPVRDLWMHEEEGSFDDSYSVSVPGRGMVLIKVGTPVAQP